MADTDYVAEATTRIRSTADEIWDALTDPERVSKYMFGTEMATDWEVGSSITWKGVWNDKPYEDKGRVLAFEPERHIEYSHYSPLSGAPDIPGNYHTVNIQLSPEDGETTVTLTQDNNQTEEARDHSQRNWSAMLQALKEHVENDE